MIHNIIKAFKHFLWLNLKSWAISHSRHGGAIHWVQLPSLANSSNSEQDAVSGLWASHKGWSGIIEKKDLAQTEGCVGRGHRSKHWECCVASRVYEVRHLVLVVQQLVFVTAAVVPARTFPERITQEHSHGGGDAASPPHIALPSTQHLVPQNLLVIKHLKNDSVCIFKGH